MKPDAQAVSLGSYSVAAIFQTMGLSIGYAENVDIDGRRAIGGTMGESELKQMSETDWAIRNLELAGLFDKDSDYEGMLGESVKRLLEVHQKEGHSGCSHVAAVHLFKAVALGEALTEEYWREKFNWYNEFSKQEGYEPWTEENFEKIVCKKPKNRREGGGD